MKVSINQDNLSFDFTEAMKRMEKLCEKEQKSVLKKIGTIIQGCVVKCITFRSGINKADYKHMKDDVQVKVKQNKQGQYYTEVAGGKTTGFKWRFLNDGAIDNRGNVLVTPTHFMEKAIEKSNPAVEAEIDNLLRRMVDDGN